MIYFGAQNDPEIGALRPILKTPLKVAQIDMYTKTDMKLVENFRENKAPEVPALDLIIENRNTSMTTRRAKFSLCSKKWNHFWRLNKLVCAPRINRQDPS